MTVTATTAATAVPLTTAGPQKYAETYPARDSSATRARHDTSLVLLTWGMEPLIESAELIVTELAANAARHGCGTIRLDIQETPQGVKLSLSDQNPQEPTPRHAASLDEGGRGLLLVEALASKWGYTPTPHGKKVWAHLPLPPE